MQYSPGEQWIRLLHGYTAVMENHATRAEHIDRLEKRTGIKRISFKHPGYERLFSTVRPESGRPRNVIVTGTAGDGKTTLCFDLFKDLTTEEPDRSQEIQTTSIETSSGPLQFTFIYDMTGWRQTDGECLPPNQVDTLASFARSVFGEGDEYFVVAGNDGQLHQVFSYLPQDPPEEIIRLKNEILTLHANSIEKSKDRLSLINLSDISSELLMSQCLEAILDRPEWECLRTEADNPLFSEKSTLRRNYELLCTPTVRSRVLMLAKIADASGFHMPIRGILGLLVNAILGHPAAKDKVLRPQKNIESIIDKTPHEAALHRTLFGDHLTSVTRNKREVYRFLSMLQIGVETTNTLDELFIFGPYHDDLKAKYDTVVGEDPYAQRNPQFAALAKEYVRGDLNEESTALLLAELCAERRRLFLTASDDMLSKLELWRSSVFHHAGDYINKLLNPLDKSENVSYPLIQRLVVGLNRAWTGLFITNQPDALYLCIGLDVTTAAISDIILGQVDIRGSARNRIDVTMSKKTRRPEMIIRSGDNEFLISLTLIRFEFLCRVADGGLPSSFSRESVEDFAMLKQRCIAKLCPPSNDDVMNSIRVTESGKIEKAPILLPQL